MSAGKDGDDKPKGGKAGAGKAKSGPAKTALPKKAASQKTAAPDTGAPDAAASTPSASTYSSKPCPICSKPSAERFHPFCSKRCADVDLHRWLSGSYAIPGRPEEEEDGEAQGEG